MPKSQILILPVASSIRFSGLRSRCTTSFSSCRQSRPSMSYLNKCFTTFSFNVIRLVIYDFRSLPEHNSMTKHIFFCVSNESQSLTMFAWLQLFKILTSSLVHLYSSSFNSKCSLLKALIATSYSLSLCIASETLPKAPLPRTRPIL